MRVFLFTMTILSYLPEQEILLQLLLRTL